MCLAVPGKIIEIDDSQPDLKMVSVDFSGITADICIQYLDEKVKVGDYILAHVGMALNKIDEEEAMATLQSFREWEELSKEMPDIEPI